MPILELEHLEKRYPAGGAPGRRRWLRAVNGVTLSIAPGETVGLVGESGCGKSTVGQMAAQLLLPSEGDIRFNGLSITKLPAAERRKLSRQVQYVFQDPYTSLNPSFRIGRLLEEPLRFHRLYDKQERKRLVLDMLERIGLDASYAQRYPHELSGGQRQRVGIARALMLNPAFIVLDEPVSALDVSVQAQILNLLKELQAERGLTYLFISHDLNVVHYMSDRVAVMYLGQIVELAEVEAVYEHPLHPYTQALVSSAEQGPGRRSEVLLLRGDLPDPFVLPEGCPFQTRCAYVHERCRKEAPVLREVTARHAVSCHLV